MCAQPVACSRRALTNTGNHGLWHLTVEVCAQPVAVPPVLLADRPGLRLWHKLDATFRLPRASATFLLASPATYDSAAAAAATHVAVALLEDKLCETAYLAEVAGLSYEARRGPLLAVQTLHGWRTKRGPSPQSS